jgi:hypothetical protein
MGMGTPVINFTRAFESAWERMMIILFRPFDLGKWFVIGFSAFLAGLLEGGNGINGSFNFNGLNTPDYTPGNVNAGPSSADTLNQLHAQVSHVFSGMTLAVIIGIVVLVVVLFFAFILLITWLGARGQFMFLDNIVRNRGAISWPWQTYARQANSFFLFYLVLSLVLFLLILMVLAVAIILCLPLFQQQRWPGGGEIAAFIALGVVYLVVGIAGNIVLFIFREFGLPIMFRQGLPARAAFLACVNLARLHPGNLCLFLLLRLAIFLGAAIVCVIACCATCCCLYQIPYLGTVIILPVLVFVRCFTLDCLAQFGPEYDVFTVDVPAAGAPGIAPPITPPPPLG